MYVAGRKSHVAGLRSQAWDLKPETWDRKPATWNLGPETRLTDDPARSERPAIAVNDAGLAKPRTLHVVWSDDRSGHREVYYKMRSAGSNVWSDDLQLSYSGVEARAPAIAADEEAVHVAWLDYRRGNWGIFYRRYTPAGGWEPEVLLARSRVEGSPGGLAMPWEPAVVTLAEGVCVAAPVYGDGVRALCRANGEAAWIASTVVSFTNNAHALALAADGAAVHAAWSQIAADNWEIFYSRSTDGGLSWAEPVRLTYHPATSWQPAIAAEGDRVHLAWADDRSGTFQVLSTSAATTVA